MKKEIIKILTLQYLKDHDCEVYFQESIFEKYYNVVCQHFDNFIDAANEIFDLIVSNSKFIPNE